MTARCTKCTIDGLQCLACRNSDEAARNAALVEDCRELRAAMALVPAQLRNARLQGSVETLDLICKHTVGNATDWDAVKAALENIT